MLVGTSPYVGGHEPLCCVLLRVTVQCTNMDLFAPQVFPMFCGSREVAVSEKKKKAKRFTSVCQNSVSRCRGQARRCRVRSRVLYWEFFSCHTTLSVSEGIVLHGNGVHIFVMPFVVLNLCLGMRQDCPTDTGAGENLFDVTIEKGSNNMS